MPWSRRPCPEPQSGFPSAAGADRDFWLTAQGGYLSLCSSQTVWFPGLAAKGTSNTTAYRTLLGHNGLHNLIILIGINRENNSLIQQESAGYELSEFFQMYSPEGRGAEIGSQPALMRFGCNFVMKLF